MSSPQEMSASDLESYIQMKEALKELVAATPDERERILDEELARFEGSEEGLEFERLVHLITTFKKTHAAGLTFEQNIGEAYEKKKAVLKQRYDEEMLKLEGKEKKALADVASMKKLAEWGCMMIKKVLEEDGTPEDRACMKKVIEETRRAVVQRRLSKAA